MRIYISIIIMFFVIMSCSKKQNINESIVFSKNSRDTLKEEDTKLQNHTLINFDFDVNINDLMFNNPKSIIDNIGTLRGKIIEEEGLPYVVFTNRKKTEKLKLILFPGSSQNDIYQFKVSQNKNRNLHILGKYDIFYTKSGVKLGITKKELIKIKGRKGIEYETKDTLRYQLYDYQNPLFFKKYNLPIYYELYIFNSNKITEFEFGFIYP